MNNELCKSCISHLSKKVCKTCVNNSKYEELYNADSNCKHNIIDANGGGIRCTKCNGWFCY